MIQEWKLPPLVVVRPHTTGSALSIPAPLPATFEAARLFESDPAFRELAEAHDVRMEGRKISRAIAAVTPQNRWSRELIELAVFVLFMSALSGLSMFLRQLPCAIFALVVAGIWVWIDSYRRGTWYVAPRSVLIRRARRFWSTASSVARFTPEDAQAIVTEVKNDFWVIELWRATLVARFRATNAEARVFLAAWQSTLAPPDVEKLTDWV